MRARGLGLGLAVALATCAAPASADDVHELRHDVAVDTAVTASAVGLVVFSELGKRDLVHACRWCDRDGRTDTLNGLDRETRSALRWESTKTAARLSDLGGFVLAPVTAFGGVALAGADADASKKTGVDMLLVLETASLAALLNQAVKFSLARERPYAHARSLAGASEPAPRPDDNLSFYSGHTSMTFVLATASGTVASLRGYRLAPAIWAAGGTVAALTGMLRIAADKHYLTDVLTGAVVGIALGALLPLTLHGRRDSDAEPASGAPAATQALSFGGAF